MMCALAFFASLSAVSLRFLFLLLSGPYSTIFQPCFGSASLRRCMATSRSSGDAGVKLHGWRTRKYVSGSFPAHSVTVARLSEVFP